jgi:hypothetical protein
MPGLGYAEVPGSNPRCTVKKLYSVAATFGSTGFPPESDVMRWVPLALMGLSLVGLALGVV